jgi:hypothetical protein
MAWDNDRNRIPAIGCAHGSRSFGISQLFRKLSIAPRFAEWYGQKSLPNIVLKSSTSHVERERERLALSSKILFQLAFCFAKNGVFSVLDEITQPHSVRIVILPEDSDKTFVARYKL